ncbi:hypothetical protein ACMFMF_009372 [Clarireedia jacksonii]
MEATHVNNSTLASLFGSQASFPGSIDYGAAQKHYFRTQEQELTPECILTPASTNDVAEMLKTIVEYQVKFAVRGGGYTLNSATANINGGIKINLRSLNRISVD